MKQNKQRKMNYSQAFQLVNLLALLTWLLLIFLPRMKYTKRIAFGFTIFVLSIVYSWMVFSTFQMDDFKEFSSLQGLMSLFQKEQAVLLGWIHYLAFDLMAGLYILENGHQAFIINPLLRFYLHVWTCWFVDVPNHPLFSPKESAGLLIISRIYV
jgi:uncharacterized protein YqcC (DUF446 family)